MFPEVTIQHLTHLFFDHCPLLINTIKVEKWVKRQVFRFEAWWTLDESFEEEVNSIGGSSSGYLLKNLDMLKHGLRSWATRIQADRKRRKTVLTNRLSEFLEVVRDDANLAELIDTKIQLNLEIDKDECY
ncbi:hypothetical protein V6Z12_A02G089800 [Gossypium hirsutum]